MPPGRPSKPTRFPVDLLERLTVDAAAAGVSVPELVEARCYPVDAVAGPGPMPGVVTVDLLEDQRNGPTSARPTVCSCSKPTPTGYGVCTTCHLRRP